MPPNRLPSASSGYHSLGDPAIHNTTNHLYKPKECLGQGASSYVYLGLHKSTGEKRALKVPKMAGYMYQKEVNREITALLSLKHQNIIKFYDVEEDESSGLSVLVMEYCNGGSLYAMLQEPEYKQGLPDSEYLLLIRDICSGLCALLAQNIVHRDIKPGNILRHVDTKGSSVFKLSDFGSSVTTDRPSTEEMGIVSMAGTEEYLHPLLYECAFVTKEGHVRTNTNVELWSVGATFYHAATGSVPFKPHGGSRNNRNAMYQMISKKPRNKISGVQETPNGRFLWSENLPRDCNLSEGLRHEMESVLVGLFETNPSRTWTYDTFFRAVDRVHECVVIYVLYTMTCDTYTIYLNKYSSFSYLRERMAETTEQPSYLHVYFYNNRQLTNEYNRVSSLPYTTRENPIILSLRDNHDDFVHINTSLDQRMCFHGNVDFYKDHKIALKILSKLYVLANYMRSVKGSLRVLQNFENNHRDYLSREVHHCDISVKEEATLIEQDIFMYDNITKRTSTGSTDRVPEFEDLMLKMRMKIISATENVNNIRKLFQNGPETSPNRLFESECFSICERIINQCQIIWQSIKDRKKIARPSAWDCLNHSNDRRQLESLSATIYRQWTLLREQLVQYSNTYGQFVRWSIELTENADSINLLVHEAEKLRRQFHENLVTLSVYSHKEKMNDDLTVDCTPTTPVTPVCKCEKVENDKKTTSAEIKTSRECIDLLKEETVFMENVINGLSIDSS